MTISSKTPKDTLLELSKRFKARRLGMNLSQEGLAVRSGVSWSSLKRFERSGLVALDALLRLALVLDCLGDFDLVCVERGEDLSRKLLDEILARPKTRKKGRLK